MRTILILEDDDERISAFQKTVATLGADLELKVWYNVPSMVAEAEEFFPTAALISLDHDLNPKPGMTVEPGTGVDASRFLGDFMPVCPVLIHSSNTDRVYSMHNELRFAGWMVARVGPLGTDWIETSWLRRARELLAHHPNTWSANLPSDHPTRVERMRLSLAGLGLGDALGEMLSYQAHTAPRRLVEHNLPAGPWFHTDDTEMAISIVAVLKSHGYLHQDALAKRFARRFERDPERGYGKMTRIQMREIMAGAKWRETAADAFGGQGSMGNGSAMRVAPLGAYFADDPERCAKEARASDTVLRHTPESQVRRGILLASTTPPETPVTEVARALGNGSLVTAPDTVPFCIWMAAHHPRHFVEAIAKTISVSGDCDTNAAIVGGIVALSAGRDSIPADWLKAREPIQI
ncbi:MAG: ADP-ribosylglycohydrolase family protein [Verrucomicrobiota bacterium]